MKVNSTDMQNKYSFDANVLIRIALEQYPQDIFPSFWKQLEKFIDADRLKVIEFVWNEVRGNSGDDYKIFESRVCVDFKNLSEKDQETIQSIVSEILKNTPSILDSSKNRVKSWGDPWIIAHAKLHNLTVVTEEKSDINNKNKIPDVCTKMWVRCMRLLDFFREMEWKI